MNAILLTAGLILGPGIPAPADPGLDALFLAQREEIVREIRNETRDDLHLQSLRFFAADGELDRQLNAAQAEDRRVAAR